jgi:hypothetical protein
MVTLTTSLEAVNSIAVTMELIGLRCVDLETICTWITKPVGALNYNFT